MSSIYDHEQPSNRSPEASQGCRCFPLFPHLPAELRLQIWDQVLNSGPWPLTSLERIDFSDHSKLAWRTDRHPMPFAALSCREAFRHLECTRLHAEMIPTKHVTHAASATTLRYLDPERHFFYFRDRESHVHPGIYNRDLYHAQQAGLLPFVRHVILCPATLRNVWHSMSLTRRLWDKGMSGQLRTITLIIAKENMARPLEWEASPSVEDDPLAPRPWKVIRMDVAEVAEIGRTPLVRDLESGGEPGNRAWEGADELTRKYLEDFPRGQPKLFWRTPEEAFGVCLD